MAGKAEGKSKPRLGRGMASLIGEFGGETDAAGAPTETIAPDAEVAIADIEANPSQPRRHFDEAELAALSTSIKANGILQPILVRPAPKKDGKYQIVAGERRWRAAKAAGLTRLPVVVRELDDLQLLEIGIIENVQRADLNPIEEAEAYDKLIKRFGRTQDSLAQSVGKSRVHIANTLRLLKLPEEARALLRDGKVSAGHARAALGAADALGVLERAAEKGLSVRDTEKLAREAAAPGSGLQTKSAPDDEKDIDTQALEADLARQLGLDVDIRHTGKTGGELRIKYKTLEQLDDLCARMTRKRG